MYFTLNTNEELRVAKNMRYRYGTLSIKCICSTFQLVDDQPLLQNSKLETCVTFFAENYIKINHF